VSEGPVAALRLVCDTAALLPNWDTTEQDRCLLRVWAWG